MKVKLEYFFKLSVSPSGRRLFQPLEGVFRGFNGLENLQAVFGKL